MLHQLLFLVSIGAVLSYCPPNTEYFPQMNVCLAVVQNGSRYGECQAREQCRQMGGDLTSIHSGFENTMIFSHMLQGHFENNAYIGGVRKDRQWVWSDGSNMTYTKWAPGQPTELDDCMMMSKVDGSWMTADCAESNIPYFCSIPAVNCPRGYTAHNGSCYMFKETNPQQYTWSQAQQFCQNDGANLVSIHSAEENDFLTAFANPNYCAVPWIGLMWDNEFTWSDGTPVDFNNSTRHQALAPAVYYIFPTCYTDGNTGWWDDVHLGVLGRSYICKRAPLPSPTAAGVY